MNQQNDCVRSVEPPDDIDAWDIESQRLGWIFWAVFFMALMGLMSHVWLGTWAGYCELGWGSRSLEGGAWSQTLVAFLVFTLTVHFVLVWPVTAVIYPRYEDKWNRAFRIAVVTLLLALPLSSFSVLVGAHGSLDFHEILMMIVPPLLISILFYESTRRTWVFSLFLSLNLFVCLYLVADKIGPYRTWVDYAVKNPSFYLVRAIFPILTMCLVARTHPKSSEPAGPKVNALVITFVALSALSIVFSYAGPIAGASFLGRHEWWSEVGGVSWGGYLLVIYLLIRKGNLAYVLLPVVACVIVALITWETVRDMGHSGISSWELSRLSLNVASAFALTGLASALRSPQMRSLFFESSLAASET